MKFLGYAMAILIVSVVFFGIGQFITELETNYIDSGISNASKINSSYTQGFDKSQELNSTLGGVLSGFTEELGQGGTGEDSGTWSVFQGIVAIPKVIIMLPVTLFNMTKTGIALVSDIGQTVGIPGELITLGLVGIMILLIFGLVRLWRQYDA